MRQLGLAFGNWARSCATAVWICCRLSSSACTEACDSGKVGHLKARSLTAAIDMADVHRRYI